MKSRRSIEQAAAEARVAAAQTRIPVDPSAVAAHLGCTVVWKNFSDDLSGVLIRKDGAVTIAVNNSDSQLRQRFTIAHECGHLALAHEGEIFIDKQVVNRRDGTSSLAIDDREIEANQFAASLLMPREEIVSHLDHLLSSCRNRTMLIEQLASKFKVSRQAMEIRLVNLGLLGSPSDDA
jgi:Zn-dependent peptidase ImmA (M78 family)